MTNQSDCAVCGAELKPQKYFGCPEHGLKHFAANALTLVRAERERQITVKGWTPEHDDQHHTGDLAQASACYIWFAAHQVYRIGKEQDHDVAEDWPFDDGYWKPHPEVGEIITRDHVIRNMVKGLAMGAAEIDRLLREHAKDKGVS